jgi:uncharacterized protein with NRDE domain
MCTLIVSFCQHSDAPLIVAANRDELRARPASGPRRWPGERFVAPRDEQAGGTWLGLTASGLFVGVTNRFLAERHPERASRGQLVVEALRHASAGALHETMAALDPRRFNAFHLLYADRTNAFVTWCDGETLRQQTLAPGLHVVTERSLGGDDHARVELIRAHYPETPTLENLGALLALRREDDPAGSVCIDVPTFDYGTRSSLVLFLREHLARSEWRWADGPPDVTPFVARPDLLEALSRAAVSG